MDAIFAALENRFAVALQQQDLAVAHDAAAELRFRYPGSDKGWVFGSIACLMSGDPTAGRVLADEYVKRHPESISALLQRAECELALGDRESALDSAATARRAARSDTAALDAIGTFLTHAREHRTAFEIYNEALNLAPSDPNLLLGRAVLGRYLGRFDDARADYDAILAVHPHHADALKGRIELSREAPRPEEIGGLLASLEHSGTSDDERVAIHFALGKAYEDAGHHADSWRHLVAGNSLHRRRLRYDANLDAAVVDRLIGSFSVAPASASSASKEAPIFVVGLPRTGTTLVERILGCHPEVHAAGELPALSEALSSAVAQNQGLNEPSWLGFINALPSVDPNRIAAEYLRLAKPWRGRKSRFTDKQPTNFYYCGPILAAFPNARIVHLTRHPLAAIHAIYKTFFPRTYPFSYQLDELADYYVGYHRLMNHWRRLYPGAIFDVSYEELVSAQEPTTRRLLDFCGLPFDAACLRFETNEAATTTASAVQVRQPIYDSSLALWRHHERELSSVRQRLAEAGVVVD